MPQTNPPTPEPAADPLLTADRRASVRYLCAPETFSYALGKGQDVCLVARVRDLSCDGIGLGLTQAVAPGTILNVELQGTDRQLPCFLLARVKHITPQADDTWLAGCQFVRRLTEDELQALS
jgi:hypothetical protein